MATKEKLRNPEWLAKQLKVHSFRSVARELGVSPTVVWKQARQFGLKSRFPARKPLHCELTSDLREILDGLLLGGGSLIAKVPGAAYFTQTSRYKEFLRWISKILVSHGIEQKGIICKMAHKGPNANSWRYASKTYFEFYDIYQRWYSHGKKQPPEDLVLTSKVAFLWYLRGGYLEVDRRCSPRKRPHIRIKFSVGRFVAKHRQFLAQLLQVHCGIRAIVYGTKIIIPQDSVGVFFSHIGPCPKELQHIFGHKWILTLPR